MLISAWLLLVVLSIVVSIAAFMWGLRTGQFSDPERARYLPLNNEFLPPPVKDPSKITVEVYALLMICVMGFMIFLTVVILSAFYSRG
jgi:cbb3-type cytochrome oxidase maturation protein